MKKKFLLLMSLAIAFSICTGCNEATGSSISATEKGQSTENNSTTTDNSEKTGKAFSGEYGKYLEYDLILPYPEESGLIDGDLCSYFTSDDGFDVYYCSLIESSDDFSSLIELNKSSFIQAIRADQVFDEKSIEMKVTSSEENNVCDHKMSKVTGYVTGEYDTYAESGGLEKTSNKIDFVSDWYVVENIDSMFSGEPFAIVVTSNKVGDKTLDELNDYLKLIEKNIHK